MKPIRRLILATALTCLLTMSLRAGATPKLGSVKASPRSLPCFQCLELTFPLEGCYQNPFDERQIDIAGQFRSPAGKESSVPGFLYQAFARELNKGQEAMRPAGDPVWKVRFAPTTAGKWLCRVVARDATGTTESAWQEFLATPGTARGYIR